MIELLCHRGADDNATNQGLSPLIYAVTLEATPKIVPTLLVLGADPEATDPDGETALYKAVDRGYLLLVQTLLRNRQSSTVLDF